MNSRLRKIIQRAEAWPIPAQDELVQAALEIEAEQQGLYHVTADKLRAIDAALEEVDRGAIASSTEVEAAFNKLAADEGRVFAPSHCRPGRNFNLLRRARWPAHRSKARRN